LWNAVDGQILDTSNNPQNVAASIYQPSIDRYGRREQRLLIDNVTSAAAAAMRDTFLRENGYPWPRAVATRPNIKIFNLNNEELNPWTVQPGVSRDASYPAGGAETDSWLPDLRDFMVDEVEVGPSGISLRTWLSDESDILEAQREYLQGLESLE
jgi:hypothetical protein